MISKIAAKAESHPQSLSKAEYADWHYFQDREEDWRMSFRSAYFMVKNKQSPYLYYINSEFSVVFSHRDDGLKAIVSQSSPGLRKALSKDGTCHYFTRDIHETY